MKNILFLNIILAIFFADALHPLHEELGSGIQEQQEYAFDECQFRSEYLFFDANLEDILEEKSSDSERKKTPSGKSSYFNTSFVAHNFFGNNVKKTLFPKFFFLRCVPLFIILCEYRL
jgi:hypothetical protein